MLEVKFVKLNDKSVQTLIIEQGSFRGCAMSQTAKLDNQAPSLCRHTVRREH